MLGGGRRRLEILFKRNKIKLIIFFLVVIEFGEGCDFFLVLSFFVDV